MIKQKFNKRTVRGFMQGGFATCWILTRALLCSGFFCLFVNLLNIYRL